MPETYSQPIWTYKWRVKQQAQAAWAARRAVRDRVPHAFKLISLGVRELEEDEHQEIGSALLLGAISGAGGIKTVAAGIGVSRDRLAAAFRRDEIPSGYLVKTLVLYLCQVVLGAQKPLK